MVLQRFERSTNKGINEAMPEGMILVLLWGLYNSQQPPDTAVPASILFHLGNSTSKRKRSMMNRTVTRVIGALAASVLLFSLATRQQRVE